MLKESGPTKDTAIVKDTMKEMVEKADHVVRGIVQGVRGVRGHIPKKIALWTTSEENDRS